MPPAQRLRPAIVPRCLRLHASCRPCRCGQHQAKILNRGWRVRREETCTLETSQRQGLLSGSLPASWESSDVCSSHELPCEHLSLATRLPRLVEQLLSADASTVQAMNYVLIDMEEYANASCSAFNSHAVLLRSNSLTVRGVATDSLGVIMAPAGLCLAKNNCFGGAVLVPGLCLLYLVF